MAHALMRSQEAAVFQAIQEEGFDNHEFSLQVTPSGRPSVVHVSGAYFAFDVNSRSEHFAIHEPGIEKPRDTVVMGDWQKQLQRVHTWLKLLTRELQTPDFWAELEATRELVATTEVENSPFTSVEQAQIATHLGELKEYVRQTHQLTQAQYEAINDKLDYLVDAASRTPRRDWQTMFLGAFVSLVLQAVVPPEPVQDILNLGLRGLAHLFGVDLPELPGRGGGGPPLSLA